MATWKKVIVSGSSAALASLTLDTALPVESGGTGGATFTDGALVVGSGTGALTSLAQATNGQLIIGSTGADPVLGTITGGSNITVTNTAGGISIAATGLGSGTVQTVSANGTENGLTLTSDGDTVDPVITLGGALTGVANSQLVNDSVILGTTEVDLGATATTLAGLTLTGVTATGTFSGSFSGTSNLPDLTSGNGLTGGPYDGAAAATFAVEADGSTLSVGASGVKVADAGITATQIASAVAGAGLSGGAGSALAVNVDGTSLEITTDTINVKAGGISNAMLANDGITIAGTDVSLGGSITAATILSGSGVVSGSDAVPNPLTDGNGIADFSYNGGTAGIQVSVEAADNTISVASGGISVVEANLSGIPNSALTNDSVTIGSTEVDLGATATTLAGLSSVTSTAFVGALTGDVTGNADTATKIASITNSNIVQLAATQALTNKDLTGAGNTFPTFNQNTTGNAATATTAAGVAANSVALGTDTTGNYVATLGSGTGVTIGSNTGEGSTPTIAVDYGSTANTAVEGDTTATFAGTTNEITVSDTSAQAIGGNIALTIGLPDDVTIGQDLTVTRDVQIGRNAVVSGNLTVAGTASFQNTQNLDVADRFIRMASGSTAVGDGGIVVQQDGPANGEAFAYDAATTRWSTTGSFDPSTEAYTPDSFMSLVVEGATGIDVPTAVVSKFQKKGNIFIGDNEDIFIYS
ncbi:hypothetical protein N9265_00020 [bacterium]|nr:hypothetical protein [bacterium]